MYVCCVYVQLPNHRMEQAHEALTKRLSERPAADELYAKNVLRQEGPNVRAKKTSVVLAGKIAARPSEDELRASNVLPDKSELEFHQQAMRYAAKGEGAHPRGFNWRLSAP